VGGGWFIILDENICGVLDRFEFKNSYNFETFGKTQNIMAPMLIPIILYILYL
jgi:hypothetical protein